jgi:hypothetical protein
MPIGAIGNAHDLIEIAISSAAVLGGAMAYCSGRAAAVSAIRGEQAEVLADRINLGLADGFIFGLPLAGIAATLLIIV